MGEHVCIHGTKTFHLGDNERSNQGHDILNMPISLELLICGRSLL